MPRKLIATVLATLAVAAFFAGAAQAKGPVVVAVSGGGLRQPIMLPGVVEMYLIFAESDSSAVRTLSSSTSDNHYELNFFQPAPDGSKANKTPLMTMTYYPAAGGQPAALRQDNGFQPVDAVFQQMLDGAIASAPAAFPAAGGPPADDGASLLWYIAPCLALAAALFYGLAGRRLLARRNV